MEERKIECRVTSNASLQIRDRIVSGHVSVPLRKECEFSYFRCLYSQKSLNSGVIAEPRFPGAAPPYRSLSPQFEVGKMKDDAATNPHIALGVIASVGKPG